MLTIVLAILRNNWKQIIIGIAIFGVVYTGYNWVWDRGYNTASIEWKALVQKQADERAQKLVELTGYARSNLEQSILNNKKVMDELVVIKRDAKGKPTTVVVNGDCRPSPDFMDSYNKAINKGNSK